MWFKLADRQHRSLQETMDSTTSSEFVEWCVFIDEQEWHAKTKTDYYLAQIAFEIRVIRDGLAKDPKGVSLKDCLLPFEEWMARSGADDEEVVVTRRAKKKEPPKQYEPGPELVKDPKWAKVNESAKMVWATRLGRPELLRT